MLKVEALSIYSSELELLAPISFTLERGKILGVIGASGSGKSLLTSAIMADVPDGFERGGKVSLTTAGGKVALAAQSATVLDPLRRVMAQLKRRFSLSSHKKGAASDIALKSIINPKISRCYPHQLSGGMAKKALLAQACYQQTDYILADEPCCGLDDPSADDIYGYLTQLAQQEQKGVLIISHNLKHLLSVADELLVMRAGKLIEHTTPKQILAGTSHAYSQALWRAIPANWGGKPNYVKAA